MKSIKELMAGPEISNWTRSEKTKSLISDEIRKRWGESELANYDPFRNALTFRTWLNLGFCPRRGEHGMKSFVVREIKDDKGKVVKTITHPVYLFYYLQVRELTKK